MMKVTGIREGCTVKRVIIAMAAFAAAFTMDSCNKEHFAGSAENAEGGCIVTASIESGLTKTLLSGDDEKGYDVVWSEGDTFRLRGEEFTLVKGAGTSSGTFKGYVSPINGSGTAFYPASYDGISWPVKQTYTGGDVTGMPMTADVNCFMGKIEGGRVEFKNAGGILRLTVKGTARVAGITVYADDTPKITLACGDGVDLDNTDGTVFHIAMPEGTYSGTSILFSTSDGRYCMKKLKKDKFLVIRRSEITTASVKVDNFQSSAPDGAVNETFTVSAEGRKVFFSKGNLYWDGSLYGFESNQYDVDVPGHQSSFFWSNTAEYARGSEWDFDPGMPFDFFTNTGEVTANPGFTANGQTGLWRTLSKDEWDFLIKRDNGIGEATINGVKGVVVFHDGYDGQTSGLTSIPDGCVFLPASEMPLGVLGFYWSSTSNTESSYIPSAAGLRYSEEAWPPSLVFDGMLERHYVRLVADLPENPGPVFTVTFDMNGKPGTAPGAIGGVGYHTTITRPADPVAAGCGFSGWYKDAGCTTAWDFSSDVVTSDITLYAKWIPEVLPGKFSVADGRQVYFSRGNLWVRWGERSPALLHFEAGQYDMQYSWDIDHLTLFNFSGSVDDAAGGVAKGDFLFCDRDHKLSVDESDAIYYAPSMEEWKYLLNSRTMKYGGERYALDITYCGVMGIVLYPDEYKGPVLASGTQYTDADFPGDCVFLPAAGYREWSSIFTAGDNGCYWSSSVCGDDPSMAYYLSFEYDKSNPERRHHRQFGFSIRLVADVD